MEADRDNQAPEKQPTLEQPGPPGEVEDIESLRKACDDLRSANADLKRSCDDLNERYLRLAADFDNFRKRTARETKEAREYALQKFAAELLDVVDNFERARKSDDASLREGLESIQKQFSGILEKHGIKPLSSLHTAFNPEEHEAVASIPSEHPEGTVVEEFIRGYRMHDRVIRHAKVAVSKGNTE
jgi:molecular chaperone GrpE